MDNDEALKDILTELRKRILSYCMNRFAGQHSTLEAIQAVKRQLNELLADDDSATISQDTV